jgi:outer membrane protein
VVLEPYLKERTTDTVESTAYNPKIKFAELNYQSSLKSIGLERANNLPVLSAYYGFSTFYYRTLSQENANTGSFQNQMADNKSQQVGIQLNVPIFNGFRNNKKIDASKIESEKTKLAIVQEKQQLDKQVALEEQNKKNYLQIQNKWREKLQYAKASLVTTQAKFTSGKVEAIVYSSVKNQFLSAEYEVLKNNLQLQYIDLKINLLKNDSL